ncbi:MAG: glycosyltransferase [Bacteroidota bacterium]
MIKRMNILHINTKDIGGAAVAAIRLHRGLLQQGIDSKFLFQENKTNEIEQSYYWKQKENTLKQQLLNKLAFWQTKQQKNKQRLKGFPRNYDMFSFADSDVDITQHPLCKEADIINLHWVPRFLDYLSFFRKCKKPLVWTLHDMNPFSGGFHYRRDVEKNTGGMQELNRQIYAVKKEALGQCHSLSVVAPSHWMYKSARQSELLGDFPVYHIPYGVDTTVFKPYDQAFARQVFNLPQDKKILLFISDSLSNERKGFDLLLNAITGIKDDSFWLCAVGKKTTDMDELKNITYLGRISDERLIALLYSACDAFVLPSREDNFPNVLLEATACGTPVIAFPVGGVPDIIEDGKNGLIASEVSYSALSEAIKTLRLSKFNSQNISDATKERYNLNIQATRYRDLYSAILK